ncbi:uncharacterized protein LOC133190585 [Saccostrea echinata]|uniref:uncharacterized protein LOC133190585 n=1 Tax=Saccostrea echinata TaxID=191078 RepID=UPI002A8104EA|nr:uncharacterized protein LOC133190585 [Saccostrea echinata]
MNVDAPVKEIFILPRFDHLTLKVRCRMEPQVGTNEVKYWSSSSSSGQWQSPTANLNGFYVDNLPSGKPLIIKTQTSQKLSLMCHYVCDSVVPCSNSFVVPPVSELGTEYTTMFPPCHGGSMCQNQCIVSNVFNSTSVNYVRGTEYDMKLLGQHLLQQPLFGIINGSYIGASYPVAVMCASYIENNKYLVHFLPPANVGGSEYKVIKANDLEDEKLIFVATDGNTIVNLSGNENQELGRFRQHFMLQDAGDQYIVDLTLDNSDFIYSFSSSKPVHVIAEFKQNSSSGNVETPPFSKDGYNFVYLPPVSNILTPTDGTSISQTVSGVTYYYLSNSGWPHRSKINEKRAKPTISRYQIPGDGIDNDKDGLTDEEYCGFIVEENPSEVGTLHDIDLDGAYNEDCKGCQGGHELTQNLICMECDFGTYRENRSRIDKCIPCGDNFTTFDIGTFAVDQCIPVCIEGMELRDTMCQPCQIGYYKNVSANDTSLNNTERFQCKQCPDGLTTYDVGTIDVENCIEHCEEGRELTGEGACKPCDIGFYKAVSSTDLNAPLDRRWNCTVCENNRTTVDIGSEQETKCIDNCAEGMFLYGTMCFPCPVGFYKSSTSEDYTISSELRWNCTQCEEGKTTYSTGSRECLDHCTNGHYLKNGTCTPCEVGFYKNTSSEDESLPESLRWACTQCPAGQTTNSTGAENCIKTCPIGKEYNDTTMDCDPCRLGTYKNVSGSHISCYHCPENYTTRHIGAVNFQDCKHAYCKCPCDRVNEVKNYTSSELAQIIDEMKEELTVNRAHLSASIRKKISVMDRRPSVQYIGSFGVLLITGIMVLLIGFDFITLREHLKMFFKNLKSVF